MTSTTPAQPPNDATYYVATYANARYHTWDAILKKFVIAGFLPESDNPAQHPLLDYMIAEFFVRHIDIASGRQSAPHLMRTHGLTVSHHTTPEVCSSEDTPSSRQLFQHRIVSHATAGYASLAPSPFLLEIQSERLRLQRAGYDVDPEDLKAYRDEHWGDVSESILVTCTSTVDHAESTKHSLDSLLTNFPILELDARRSGMHRYQEIARIHEFSHPLGWTPFPKPRP